MKLGLIVGLTGLVGLAACFGSDYQVHPDPGVAPSVMAAARAAAADWMSAAARAHVPLTITVEADACPATRALGLICIHPVASIASVPWEPGILVGYTSFHEMWLAEPALESSSPAEVQRVIAHEMGHAMGLVHPAKPDGSLMWPYPEGGSLTVTPADIAQWQAVQKLQHDLSSMGDAGLGAHAR